MSLSGEEIKSTITTCNEVGDDICGSFGWDCVKECPAYEWAHNEE